MLFQLFADASLFILMFYNSSHHAPVMNEGFLERNILYRTACYQIMRSHFEYFEAV